MSGRWRPDGRAIPGRESIEHAAPPGAWIIRCWSALVPADARELWSLEWRAELLHEYDARLARGEAPAAARWALRRRALAAAADVFWMRRHYGEGDRMIGADLRDGGRALVRHAGFSALVVLTVALGIGATTAIFSVVDGLLLRPPPYAAPHRLAELWTFDRKHDATYPGLAEEVARAWQAQPGLFDRVESYRDASVLVRRGDEPAEVRATMVSAGLLPMLGVVPLVGRLFAADELRADGPPVVVVSEAFWREAFGGARSAIGRTITVDGVPHTVIGVMPRAFKFPLGTVSLWMPLRPSPATPGARPPRVNLVVRTATGADHSALRVRLDALGAQLERDTPRDRGWSARAQFLDEHRLVGFDTKRALWVLIVGVACVLLIGCANAANLLLVRGAVRQRELAIRGALGATRARLVRQLLTESLVLAAASGVLGMALAYAGVRAILAIMPKEIIDFTQNDIAVDVRVLGFAVALACITGLLFGVGPALRASRASASFSIADRSGTGTIGAQRTRGVLVAAELALSMVLLLAAGLFLRSFARLTAVHPGFDAEHVLRVTLPLTTKRYGSVAGIERFTSTLTDRLLALPGVRRVAQSGGGGTTFGEAIEAEGRAESLALAEQMLPFTSVDTGYFATLGIPILRGRGFAAEDRDGRPPVVILDPDFASALWPDASPIGRRFRVGKEGEWLTVVGVAGDVKMMGADDRRSRFGLYYAGAQGGLGSYRVIEIRTQGDPALLIREVKRLIWSLRPDQPLYDIQSAAVEFGESYRTPRFVLTLMSTFAVVALVLAAVGIYGVIAYAVAQRTREIGIRMALGARGTTILGAVVGRGLLLAATGTIVGIVAALALTRFVSRLLFGVSPTDPAVIAATAVLLLAVSALAALIPAWRASRVSPMIALRDE